jgi:hypothetical protein
MSKPITFTLQNESLKAEFGTVTFNGKFVFELSDTISPNVWSKIGFIPLEEGSNKTESTDLFFYLNSRLPIELRDKPAKEKLAYIKDQGLRVASDSFVLKPLKA